MNLPGNRLRNLGLHAENIAQIALIAFRPELRLILDLAKPRGDAHAIARATHFSLQRVIDTEILLHQLQRLYRGIVALGAGASDHGKLRRLQTIEYGGHLIRQPVAEIVFFFAIAEVTERKNRKLDLICGLILSSCGNTGSRWLAGVQPLRQLRTKGVHRAQLLMLMTIDRQAFLLLPALDGA